MLTETISRVKRYIGQYQNIQIAFAQERQEDGFPAALALFYTLKDLGKNATLLNRPLPEKYQFLIQAEKMSPVQSNFLIAIKEDNAKIDELSYKKTTFGINIFLKTKGELKPSDIMLEPTLQDTLLITTGIKCLKEIEGLLSNSTYLVLNIDNNPENEHFGQVNLIEPAYASVCEIVFEIIKEVANLNNPLVCLAMATGIINQTTGALRKQTLNKLQELTSQHVDFTLIANQLFPENAQKRLFVKTLERLEESQKEIGFVSLEARDFIETNSLPNNLSFTLERALAFPFKESVFLWEQNMSPLFVRGIFISQEPKKKEALKNVFGGQEKGRALLFNTNFSNVKEAKEKISQILQNI